MAQITAPNNGLSKKMLDTSSKWNVIKPGSQV